MKKLYSFEAQRCSLDGFTESTRHSIDFACGKLILKADITLNPSLWSWSSFEAFHLLLFKPYSLDNCFLALWRTPVSNWAVFSSLVWDGWVLWSLHPRTTGWPCVNTAWTPARRWMSWEPKGCGQTASSPRDFTTAFLSHRYWTCQVGTIETLLYLRSLLNTVSLNSFIHATGLCCFFD